MEWEIYELEKSADGLEYSFYSEGPRGRIRKVIRFQWIRELGSNTFNLAFGDLIEGSGQLNDRSISNNQDRLKVLRTVAMAAANFLKDRRMAIIWIVPNSLVRARLYQMMISSIWTAIKEDYEVQGKHRPYWNHFVKGLNYTEFIVYKKIK
jgi:hypothetical protein